MALSDDDLFFFHFCEAISYNLYIPSTGYTFPCPRRSPVQPLAPPVQNLSVCVIANFVSVSVGFNYSPVQRNTSLAHRDDAE